MQISKLGNFLAFIEILLDAVSVIFRTFQHYLSDHIFFGPFVMIFFQEIKD